MIINFKINQQKLETSDKIFLADKSNNIIQCKFHISGEDWKNKQKFALLRDNNCNTYQLHLSEENTIKIPSDILAEEKFSISLYGEDDEETRITTNMVNFRLANSGYTEDIKDLEDIDENIWVQIFDGIDSKSDVDHTHIVEDITDFPSLSEVALSGSYDDLTDKPYIPVRTSDLVNDGDGHNVFVKNNDARLSDTRNPKPHTHSKSEIVDLVLATVAATGEYNDLNNLPVIPVNVSDLLNDSGFITEDSITKIKYNRIYNSNVDYYKDSDGDWILKITGQNIPFDIRGSTAIAILENKTNIDFNFDYLRFENCSGFVHGENVFKKNDVWLCIFTSNHDIYVDIFNMSSYLTEHQDISMKADKTYVDNEITDIKDYVDETIGNLEEDMLL